MALALYKLEEITMKWLRSIQQQHCILLIQWLRLVGWPLRISSILVSYKGIVVKMPNQTGCCCFFFIMRKWNAFFEVVIDDTWRWMLTRFFHWQQITTRKNNNKAQKAFSHKSCAQGIWICRSCLFYKRELWASKSAGAQSTESITFSGCKRWCPKDPLYPC